MLPLTAATDALLEAMRVAGYAPPRVVATAMARRCVRAYMAVSPRNPRLATETRELMEMAVGETRVMASATRAMWRRRMATARKIMGVPDACWHAIDANTITRMPDGSPPLHNPRRSGRAVFLASLTVSQGWVLAPGFKDIHSATTNTKAAACRILGRPDARWMTKTTAAGVMVKRVAT